MIGEGTSAVLTPQIVNGRIISVTINQSGIGYGTSTTSIQVVSAGSGVEFKSKIQTWRVNNFRKNLTNISEDDLFIEKSKNENYGLQFTVKSKSPLTLTAARKQTNLYMQFCCKKKRRKIGIFCDTIRFHQSTQGVQIGGG